MNLLQRLRQEYFDKLIEVSEEHPTIGKMIEDALSDEDYFSELRLGDVSRIVHYLHPESEISFICEMFNDLKPLKDE
tara:strand:- start:1957 stop:2187 length:231 start_codon:yes stop_codon:yes gene_type:complete